MDSLPAPNKLIYLQNNAHYFQSLIVTWSICLGLGSRSRWQSEKSCLTLCDPMDYTVHGILQDRILEWVVFSLLQGVPNLGSNPGLPHCRRILYQLSYQGSSGDKMIGTTQIVRVVMWGTFRKNFRILENSPGKGLFLLRLSVSHGQFSLGLQLQPAQEPQMAERVTGLVGFFQHPFTPQTLPSQTRSINATEQLL